MPRGFPIKNCVICGKAHEEVGSLSARGKCERCAIRRIAANNLQLRVHAGPLYSHWQRSLVHALGGVLLDDARDEG